MLNTKVDMTTENDISLKMKRQFDAPRERVFDAWTDQDVLRQWMGPQGVDTPEALADARVGGGYRFPMVGKDSGSVNTVVGQYTEIDRPRKISFTWSWLQDDGSTGQQMSVTLEFIDLDGRTEMILTHNNFVDEEARQLHKAGWNSSFICLDSSLNN